MSYLSTSLWKRTLGDKKKDDQEYNNQVELLRDSFLDARKNAEFLLDKIRKDFPNLTVHDITHVDSLWNVADTIIGKKYPINPLEGYVLGVAFLIHDAALSYDVVGGKDRLRKTIEWKDVYADGAGEKDEEEFKKECDFAAIRALHAKYAEDLLFRSFTKGNGTSFYIVDNDSYRNHFGRLIGKIAASHHWSIDDVESGLKKPTDSLNGMPGDWTINAIKLACILRCADAGHIDDGRAPDSIYRSLHINGVSRQHWESQNHLCQVCEDESDSTKLRITSSYPFVKKEFDAWNVAFDAVRQFDKELKKSNNLLDRITPKTNDKKDLIFPHVGVLGAESKEALANYIDTEGWTPYDGFEVHTSNVKFLIENLGLSELYGEYEMLLIALRELIQNSRDAICARKVLDDGFDEGRITIRLKEENGDLYFEVEDNGIGMSLDCIKDHLLDFGSSYWKSSLAMRENPGLRSKGYKSVGKFGIGFYSVFMVSNSVEVVTRRYDEGKKSWRIEFPKGLTLSPILSPTNQNVKISTKVRFKAITENIRLRYKIHDWGDQITDLSKALSLLTIGLDVDVYYENKALSLLTSGWDKDIYCSKTEAPIIIHPNVKSSSFDRKRWLDSILIHVPNNIDFLASKLESIYDANGNLRGWLLPPEYVPDDDEIPFSFTIGGLSSELDVPTILGTDHGVIGYIEGIGKRISRDDVILDIPLKKQLNKWVREKYNLNYSEIVNNISVAYNYRRLIDSCELELKEDIAKDNNKRLYSKTPSDIRVGTIKGLKKIHFYLFVGVRENAGDFCYRNGRSIEYVDNRTIDELFDLAVEDKVFLDELRHSYSRHYQTRREIVVWAIVGLLPASSFKEIIDKYCFLLLCHPFVDGNKRALGVWVNLLLDGLMRKKVAWEMVDEEELKRMIDDTYSETLRHLEGKIGMRDVKEAFVKNLTKDVGDKVSEYLKNFLN